MKQSYLRIWSACFLLFIFVGGLCLQAAEPVKKNATENQAEQPEANGEKQDQSDLVPLNKQKTVLLDLKHKKLYLRTHVCLVEGVLEMLCCKKQTKEHESILSIDSSAKAIHAGLLAMGAKAGTPVKFTPKFQPPTGQKLDIILEWKDKAGKVHREQAQKWIRSSTSRYFTAKLDQLPPGVVIDKKTELRYDDKYKELIWFGEMTKEERDQFLAKSDNKTYQAAIKKFYEKTRPRLMEADWVFAGSGFSIDEMTGEKYYHAESGDLICVANFPTAIIDVSIESSASGEGNLLFEANKVKIPPRGTPVTIEISIAKEKPSIEKSAD